MFHISQLQIFTNDVGSIIKNTKKNLMVTSLTSSEISYILSTLTEIPCSLFENYHDSSCSAQVLLLERVYDCPYQSMQWNNIYIWRFAIIMTYGGIAACTVYR